MFGLFGGPKKPEQPVKPYIPPGMPPEIALPNLGLPAPPSMPPLDPALQGSGLPGVPMPQQPPLNLKGINMRPPPGVTPRSIMPPSRPADLPAPGASNAGPSTPAPGQSAGPGYEYFQTQDDMGRSLWSTRPTGTAGSMNGQGQALPQFQNAGTGMSFDQAQQSIGAGSGVSNFFNALGGNAPPGASGGPSVPPGALQGPMPNGQSLDQVQGQPGGFTNPLVADPNASAASNFFNFLGKLGGGF